MDDRGLSVPDGMDTVLDLRLVMVEDDYSYLLQNASYEVYRPFQSATVTVRDKPDQVVLALNSPGRVRPKGQFSLYMPLCIGTSNFPFQLDFSDTNSSQTLFGAERVYLRSHFGDNSYARDWAYYRMAARFGLPHLRARKVRFFINDQVHGFYTLLEAPDQAYVFQRNFPLYDFTNYALYKVKTTALGCGQYTDQELETAQARLVSSSEATPPYAFERGEHKSKVVPAAAQGPTALTECFFSFFGSVAANDADSALAYLRYNQNCADMLVEEGLVDRDLGSSSWDSPMKKFIDAGAFDYPQAVDVTSAPALAEPLDPYEWMDTDSTLKMIAFYAVALIMDSPMGNGNNFYWLQTGEEANGGSGGWKIFPYDFNSPSTIICGATCDTKMVYWSIVQPTCSHLTKNPVVGPLLSDATLQETYLKYVEEFLETVYANATFVQELQDHIQAQDVDVRNDSWSAGGIFYDAEQSPEASQWNDSIPNFPFLPTMKARAASVREQLDAIADGTFPRGAHGVGLGGDYEMWESCPDWRLTEAPGSECPQSCRYEGCHTPGWIVESSCDVASKTCVRGNFDPLCNGVPDGGRYEGMEEGPGIVCFNVNGFDTKMESCPPFVEEEEDDEIVEEGMSHAGVLRPALYTAVLVLVILSLLS
ncbi:spore coat protein CotH [Seminavis robusta]|uniref:Spore coat protein CotH n=1 Tax=Seminavis robusta TaxID=568900 RepID=A0A9N8E838_9STRA|nr:spore coat protein CotH [Seminavis robusta]|eukprot:Sro786_g202290.1 spore coat protein CotH (649) ;mRNA; f:46578-48524